VDDEQQLCGATTDIDWQTTFECELPPGHAGDHEMTYAWSNEPIGPKLLAVVVPRTEVINRDQL